MSPGKNTTNGGGKSGSLAGTPANLKRADNLPFVKLGRGDLRGSGLFALPVQAEQLKDLPDCVIVVVEVL
jgi:hypothetical protein